MDKMCIKHPHFSFAFVKCITYNKNRLPTWANRDSSNPGSLPTQNIQSIYKKSCQNRGGRAEKIRLPLKAEFVIAFCIKYIPFKTSLLQHNPVRSNPMDLFPHKCVQSIAPLKLLLLSKANNAHSTNGLGHPACLHADQTLLLTTERVQRNVDNKTDSNWGAMRIAFATG